MFFSVKCIEPARWPGEDRKHSCLRHQQAVKPEPALRSRALCKCYCAYLEDMNSLNGKISETKYQLRTW